jgi:hypothetical protein
MSGGLSRRGTDDEWVRVLRTRYAFARDRHAAFRAGACDVTRDEWIAKGRCGPELRIRDIDATALDAWKRTWRGQHPSGAGGWNWPTLVEGIPRRAAVLPIAIWYGADLCGLALGQASRPRLRGARHTVTLTHVERRPEPPGVALRGQIVSLATTVALRYGEAVGARRLRLRNPDRHLLGYYQSLGFTAVWKGQLPVYCEWELYP